MKIDLPQNAVDYFKSRIDQAGIYGMLYKDHFRANNFRVFIKDVSSNRDLFLFDVGGMHDQESADLELWKEILSLRENGAKSYILFDAWSELSDRHLVNSEKNIHIMDFEGKLAFVCDASNIDESSFDFVYAVRGMALSFEKMIFVSKTEFTNDLDIKSAISNSISVFINVYDDETWMGADLL